MDGTVSAAGAGTRINEKQTRKRDQTGGIADGTGTTDPRVYQLPFSQENDRPALGYIRGDRFSLMVDAGNSPEHVRDYQRQWKTPDFPAGFYGADPFPLGSLFRAVCPVDPVHCLCADETVSGDGLRLRWTPDALAENVRKGIVPQLCVPRIQAHFPNRNKSG